MISYIAMDNTSLSLKTFGMEFSNISKTVKCSGERRVETQQTRIQEAWDLYFIYELEANRLTSWDDISTSWKKRV